ncbi:MAG: OB-fold nucleic acid binding domain-containing protein [Candidatus Hydrothermarchaeales archaeon]
MDDRTGYKLFIRDITDRPLNSEEGRRPYVNYNGLEVSTVRVMGAVVSRYDSEGFTILTIDDSTETVSVRTFGEDVERVRDIGVGDTVDVIGTLREYEGETYIMPRSLCRVEDPNWEVVRNLELLIRAKKTGVGVAEGRGVDVEEVVEEDLKPIVLRLIEKLDSGDGADYKTLLKESSLEDAQLDQALNDLLSDSDIYEPKIGRFKKV